MGAGINHDICASMVTNGSKYYINIYVLDSMEMVFVMMINYDDDVCSHGGDMMMMAMMMMMLAMMTMMIVISVMMMILVILMVMMMMSVVMALRHLGFEMCNVTPFRVANQPLPITPFRVHF